MNENKNMTNQEIVAKVKAVWSESLSEMGITCENCKCGNDPKMGCCELCVLMNELEEKENEPLLDMTEDDMRYEDLNESLYEFIDSDAEIGSQDQEWLNLVEALQDMRAYRRKKFQE